MIESGAFVQTQISSFKLSWLRSHRHKATVTDFSTLFKRILFYVQLCEVSLSVISKTSILHLTKLMKRILLKQCHNYNSYSGDIKTNILRKYLFTVKQGFT